MNSKHGNPDNHLTNENSPYLLSHADNPVNWYPWGEAALERARREDKPIFLSIGYSACHWCHVMERESFENVAIAGFLNEHFISVKVDREQRPDLDRIYMAFTTAMSGHGGWPMSVFLTPDLKPFFAGTYFPPDDRMGRPGFMKVISEIARAYREEKETIVTSSQDIFEQVARHLEGSVAGELISKEMIRRAADSLLGGVDDVYGGFGQQPKFPHATELSLFLRHYKATGDLRYLHAVEKALKGMARGGIYDQLGGGFARYSTDRRWLVPHFEKMLYDNALLAVTYAEAYQVTGDETYVEIVRGTLDFILREMTDSRGGFYSAIDADSEGEEGKFYVWSKDEIENVLSRKAQSFCRYYGVTDGGNFEGANILHVTAEADRMKGEPGGVELEGLLKESRERLLEERNKRVRPLTDDKILTSWNGLALSAFCRGYRVTGDERYLEAAVENGRFVSASLYRDGQLSHAYRDGRFTDGLFLEDHAYYTAGLLDLWETDHRGNNIQWLKLARRLADSVLERFVDDDGRFYLRPAGEADLIVRPKDETDGALPAPGSVMISNLLKLHRITSERQYADAAEKGLKAVSGLLTSYPGGMASAVLALDYYLNDKIEVVVVGEGAERDEMLAEVFGRYLPNSVVAFYDGRDELPALFEGRVSDDGEVRAFVCVNSACRLPAESIEQLKQQLDGI